MYRRQPKTDVSLLSCLRVARHGMRENVKNCNNALAKQLRTLSSGVGRERTELGDKRVENIAPRMH